MSGMLESGILESGWWLMDVFRGCIRYGVGICYWVFERVG